jgi:hypothetical protein
VSGRGEAGEWGPAGPRGCGAEVPGVGKAWSATDPRAGREGRLRSWSRPGLEGRKRFWRERGGIPGSRGGGERERAESRVGGDGGHGGDGGKAGCGRRAFAGPLVLAQKVTRGVHIAAGRKLSAAGADFGDGPPK